MRILLAGLIASSLVFGTGLALAAPPSDLVAHGDIVVEPGDSVGDVISFGGSITVYGWVTGDAVSLGGGIHLLPGARVDGDITSLGGSIIVDPGAVAFGNQTGLSEGGVNAIDPGVAPIAEPIPQNPPGEARGAASFIERWFQGATERFERAFKRLGHMLSLYALLVVLGMIMLGAAPLRTRALAAAVAARPGKSLGLGLLVILGSVVGIVLLSITVVGLPIAAVLAVVVGCATVLGLTGVSILIGELIPSPSLRDRQFLKLLLGAGVLVVALSIPYAGGFVAIFATLLGLGSIAMTRLRPGHVVFSGKGPYRSAPSM